MVLMYGFLFVLPWLLLCGWYAFVMNAWSLQSLVRPPAADLLLPTFSPPSPPHPSPACFSNKLRDVTAFELHRCNFTGPLPGMDYRR